CYQITLFFLLLLVASSLPSSPLLTVSISLLAPILTVFIARAVVALYLAIFKLPSLSICLGFRSAISD
ncbi:hypothetical protein L6452_11791, partial [Arctium lappa]